MSVSPIYKTGITIISSHIPGGHTNTVFKMLSIYYRDKHCVKAEEDMNNSPFGQAVTGGTANKAQTHSGQSKQNGPV